VIGVGSGNGSGMVTRTATEELVELERESWEALTTAGAAAPFYERLLADDIAMLLPGGMVIDDRQAVIESMSGAPWDEYEMVDDAHVLPLGDWAAVVHYRAKARRADHRYEALFASTYVRERGEWKLAAHQQTPV
jgi:hypothetical protein